MRPGWVSLDGLETAAAADLLAAGIRAEKCYVSPTVDERKN
jgi:hypothetical protein